MSNIGLIVLLVVECVVTEYRILSEDGSKELGSFNYPLFRRKRAQSANYPVNKSAIVQEDNHKYYTSKVKLDNSRWIEIYPQRTNFQKDTIHVGLSNKFRYAYNIKLPFEFPYYGLPLTSITPTTGGFIYVGDMVHRRLTETQYIAPLMAEFNPSLENGSYVCYYMDDTKVIVQWEQVHLHTGGLKNKKDKPYTFQVQLYKSGDIIFSYLKVPYSPNYIDPSTHHVKVGLSEAFYEVDQSRGITVTYIHKYHTVDLMLDKISNGTFIQLFPEPTCVTSKSCADCTTRNLPQFQCSWCHALQQCSDGVSRWRQQWEDKGCSNNGVNDSTQCPNERNSALPVYVANTGSYEVILCQKSKTSVVCAGSDKLEINKATFSRSNTYGSMCQRPDDIFNEKALCEYDNDIVTNKLMETCNGNRTCFVYASSDYFDHVDPCPNNDKTLKIYYKCHGSQSVGAKVATAFAVLLSVAVIAGVAGWVLYAYRYPTTPSGLFLIKYGRFWKSNPYKEDTPSDSRI